MTSRRRFLVNASGSLLAGMLPIAGRAAGGADARLSVWILRGGLDGLAAVAPYGDPGYAGIRGSLALESQLDLDGQFGLHPALPGMHAMFAARELLVVHALATPYRERSHFDGQKVLENGTLSPGTTSGWLNRLLDTRATLGATAIGSGIPLILRGDAPVASWAPSLLPGADSDTLDRIMTMYADDPVLAARLQQGLAARDMAGNPGAGSGNQPGRGRAQLLPLIAAAARLMRDAQGTPITVLDINGWDTHANQGTTNGALALRLRSLDDALARFKLELGPQWRHTAVLVVTEFGRTAAPNGTRGTDHGTASVAFLAGGAVNGGRVVTDWPGLRTRDLHDQRDLKPTLDSRALCKAVLRDHLAIADSTLATAVFPDSDAIAPLRDLIRQS